MFLFGDAVPEGHCIHGAEGLVCDARGQDLVGSGRVEDYPADQGGIGCIDFIFNDMASGVYVDRGALLTNWTYTGFSLLFSLLLKYIPPIAGHSPNKSTRILLLIPKQAHNVLSKPLLFGYYLILSN